jgi:antitoxin YefM
MDVLSYTHVRQNLKRVMDEVCEKKTPIIVRRQNASSVVVMSLDEYNAMEETLHLLRSSRNARRLLRAIANAESGKLVRREPIKG